MCSYIDMDFKTGGGKREKAGRQIFPVYTLYIVHSVE